MRKTSARVISESLIPGISPSSLKSVNPSSRRAHALPFSPRSIATFPSSLRARAVLRVSSSWRSTARALRELGNVAMLRGENGRACALLEEGLTLFRELGDMPGINDSLITLADVFLIQGKYTSASSLLEESLAFYRKAGLVAMVSQTLNLLANAVFFQG